MSANRYNSITEIFYAECLVSSLALSTYGTVPGTVTVPPAAFKESLFESLSINTGLPYFSINDIPSIKSLGVYSPLADGLANQPGTSGTGALKFTLKWRAYNVSNVQVGSDLFSIPLSFQTMNVQEVLEMFHYFTDPAVLAILNAAIVAGAVKTALVFSPLEDNWAFAAYSMNSAWSAALLDFYIYSTVEHTFPTII